IVRRDLTVVMRWPDEAKPCLVRWRVCDSARGRRGAGGADGTHGRIRTEIGTAAEPRTVSEDVGIRQSCRAATGDVAERGSLQWLVVILAPLEVIDRTWSRGVF